MDGMSHNRLDDSPIPVAIVQSDTTTFNPPLAGIDVFTTGDVSILTELGVTITKTFPAVAAGGSYPYRWLVRIVKVFDTNTTVADAALVGLKY